MSAIRRVMDASNFYEPIRRGGAGFMVNFDLKVVSVSGNRRWNGVWKREYETDLNGVSFRSNVEHPIDVCKDEEDRYSPDYIKRVLRLSELKACTN
jgi:hypothetical protein